MSDPFTNTGNILSGANDAVQSSAPPYVPLVSGTQGIDPYTGQQNFLPNISTEINYNQMQNPSYWNPNMAYTYTPIQDTMGTELQYPGLLGGMYQYPAQADIPYTANAAWYSASQVTDPSKVQDEMSTLLNSNTNQNGIPSWAQPAATAANQRMNALGLGSSTMAGNAQTAAILGAATPMAMQNATLNQQRLLSNASMDNAAKQFNAQSINQVNQFRENLSANILLQNAQMTNDMTKFLTNLNSQRQQFNIQNQLLVDQSNVQWRRAINTANTAGINAVNQANAQNMFNMSMNDQNNLWQQARDEASWALTSEENARNRLLSLVNSSLNRSTSFGLLNSTLNAQMFSQLGSFATNLLGGSFGNNLFSGLFGGSGGSGGNNSTISGTDLSGPNDFGTFGNFNFGGG